MEQEVDRLISMLKADASSPQMHGGPDQLTNQLKAIELLGETGSSRALEYLRQLASYETNSSRRTEVLSQWTSGTTMTAELVDVIVDFPNARGEVKKALRMKYSEQEGGPHSYAAYAGLVSKDEAFNANVAYQRLRASIEQLESDISKA